MRGGAAATRARIPGLTLTRADFDAAYKNVAPHIYRTPILTSRSLSEACGLDVRLKAELFQRGGSYKVRGPLNKIARLTEAERARGVICSSAGNHAQGVAIAARHYGVRAVVVMAENATRSKVAATEGYGARVVLHGRIWDEANEKALELVEKEGFTYIHPFDDPDLIAGQGSVGLEIMEQFPDEMGCIIDGLRVLRVGDNTCSIVSRFVDEIVTLPDEQIFDAVLWLMTRTKLVTEGAAASPVGALLQGLVDAPHGTKTVCVLSGGNLDVEQLRGLSWN